MKDVGSRLYSKRLVRKMHVVRLHHKKHARTASRYRLLRLAAMVPCFRKFFQSWEKFIIESGLINPRENQGL